MVDDLTIHIFLFHYLRSIRLHFVLESSYCAHCGHSILILAAQQISCTMSLGDRIRGNCLMSFSYSLAHVCPEREVQLTENISHTVLPLISAALEQE